jgi:hypothetical protein
MARHRRKPEVPADSQQAPVDGAALIGEELIWLKAAYAFHSFGYRDPRSAFASAVGCPVVSPTGVLLGVASTLFSLGRAEEARDFLRIAHLCHVAVDPPEGMIFFRAFHQVRRYVTDKHGANPRLGFTDINQATREHALVQGTMTLYVGTPRQHSGPVKIALSNRDHLGTHDSLCSLSGNVEECTAPIGVLYQPLDGSTMRLPDAKDLTVVTLSRFRQGRELQPTVGEHWWIAGGDDTELLGYLIEGSFHGTSRGKIYRKH